MGPPRNVHIPSIHHKKCPKGHDIRSPVDGFHSSSVATERLDSRSISAGGRTPTFAVFDEPISSDAHLKATSGIGNKT